jgi:hypothetical protein
MDFSMKLDLPEDGPQKPETAEAYMAIARSLTALMLLESHTIEKALRSGEIHIVLQRLPGMISIVNTIAYLRGQDGFFLDERPAGVTDFQKELYGLEATGEKFLDYITREICNDPAQISKLRARLMEYFVQARIPRDIIREEARRKIERFTVNLNEIEINPRIPEDKIFEDWDTSKIEKDVEEYVTTKYPEQYSNRHTLNRLTHEAIRNGNGTNNKGLGNEIPDRLIPKELWPKERLEKYEEVQAIQAKNRKLSDEKFLKGDELLLWKTNELDRIYAEEKEQLETSPEAEHEIIKAKFKEQTEHVFTEYMEQLDKLWEQYEVLIKKNWELDSN